MKSRFHNMAIAFFWASAILFIALAFTGCASSGTQVKGDQLHAFVPHQTTKADVIKALGPPQNSFMTSEGTSSLMYVYTHMQMKARSFIPYVGLFTGGAKTAANTVMFNFDRDDRLIDYRASDSAQDVRTGLVSGAH